MSKIMKCKIKKLTLVLTLIIGLLPFRLYCPSEANMPDIDVSPQQLEKMEGLMHEMQNFYESLSPEDKAQFEAELATEVEKEQRKLSAMTPEQQKDYVESAFQSFDEINLEELEAPATPEGEFEGGAIISPDIPEFEGDAPKKKKTVEDEESKKKTIKEMLNTIDEVVKIIESLKEKFGAIKPSAQDLVDKWIQKGYVQRWAEEKSNWATFSADLEVILQRTKKLKDTDPKTGKYKYLDDTKSAKPLMGQLEMLLNTMQRYEPSVELTSEGKVKKGKSKSALKRLVNYLVDTTTTISKSELDLIGKFDPEAKKIMLEEEKQRKEAEKYKKPRRPKRAIEAGKKEYPRYDRDYYPESYGEPYGDNYYPSDYYPEYPTYDDRYAEPTKVDKDKAMAPDKDKEKAKPDEKKKAIKLAEVKDLYDKTMKEKKYKTIGNVIKRIEKYLQEFTDEFAEQIESEEDYKDKWKKLPEYLKTMDEADPGLLKRISLFTEPLAKATKLLTGLPQKIKDSVKTPADRKNIQQYVEKIQQEYDASLQKISDMLNKIKPEKLKPNVRDAFFGVVEEEKPEAIPAKPPVTPAVEPAVEPAVPEEAPTVPALPKKEKKTYNLADLGDAVSKASKAFKELSKL